MNVHGSEVISGGLSVGASLAVNGSETVSGNLLVAGPAYVTVLLFNLNCHLKYD